MKPPWSDKLSDAGYKFSGHVTVGSLDEQISVVKSLIRGIVDDLRQVGNQCEAGGHKSRARMFRALAKRFEYKYLREDNDAKKV